VKREARAKLEAVGHLKRGTALPARFDAWRTRAHVPHRHGPLYLHAKVMPGPGSGLRRYRSARPRFCAWGVGPAGSLRNTCIASLDVACGGHPVPRKGVFEKCCS